MPESSRIIRLACTECDRQDKYGITEDKLGQCVAEGWVNVSQEQSFEQSCQTFGPGEEPGGFAITAWYTHLGLCPECGPEQ